MENPKAIEVWGIDGATLLTVDSVASTSQNVEMDSGDWVLVRISGLPPSPGLGVLKFTRHIKASGTNGKSDGGTTNGNSGQESEPENEVTKETEPENGKTEPLPLAVVPKEEPPMEPIP